MNYLFPTILLIPFILFINPLDINSDWNKYVNTSLNSSFALNSECPEENPKARKQLEKFLTSTSYYHTRVEAGVNELSTDQIRVLSDSNSTDQQICEELNSTYSSKDFPSRVTAYYKVGNFYFVSRPLIQNPDSEYAIMGPNFIDILDSHQNLIKKIDM